MKTSTMSEIETPAPYCSRRGFMLRSMGLVVTAAAFSAFTPLSARSDTTPSAADLEVAILGDWLREYDPESAVQLAAEARKACQLTATQVIEWPIARLARIVLTEDVLIAGELARANVVFVDGWLLARSEAGAALLFAEARSHSKFQAGLVG